MPYKREPIGRIKFKTLLMESRNHQDDFRTKSLKKSLSNCKNNKSSNPQYNSKCKYKYK